MQSAGNICNTLAFKWYVNGLHWDGSQVTTTVYKNRGRAIATVCDNWLQVTQWVSMNLVIVAEGIAHLIAWGLTYIIWGSLLEC